MDREVKKRNGFIIAIIMTLSCISLTAFADNDEIKLYQLIRHHEWLKDVNITKSHYKFHKSFAFIAGDFFLCSENTAFFYKKYFFDKC